MAPRRNHSLPSSALDVMKNATMSYNTTHRYRTHKIAPNLEPSKVAAISFLLVSLVVALFFGFLYATNHFDRQAEKRSRRERRLLRLARAQDACDLVGYGTMAVKVVIVISPPDENGMDYFTEFSGEV
jgi:hypothetical protein